MGYSKNIDGILSWDISSGVIKRGYMGHHVPRWWMCCRHVIVEGYLKFNTPEILELNHQECG